jgi:hypothetical protein
MKKNTTQSNPKLIDRNDLSFYLTYTLIVDEKDWEHIQKLTPPKTKKNKG